MLVWWGIKFMWSCAFNNCDIGQPRHLVREQRSPKRWLGKGGMIIATDGWRGNRENCTFKVGEEEEHLFFLLKEGENWWNRKKVFVMKISAMIYRMQIFRNLKRTTYIMIIRKQNIYGELWRCTCDLGLG